MLNEAEYLVDHVLHLYGCYTLYRCGRYMLYQYGLYTLYLYGLYTLYLYGENIEHSVRTFMRCTYESVPTDVGLMSNFWIASKEIFCQKIELTI